MLIYINFDIIYYPSSLGDFRTILVVELTTFELNQNYSLQDTCSTNTRPVPIFCTGLVMVYSPLKIPLESIDQSPPHKLTGIGSYWAFAFLYCRTGKLLSKKSVLMFNLINGPKVFFCYFNIVK